MNPKPDLGADCGRPAWRSAKGGPGFILLEILTALLLFALVVGPLVQAFASARQRAGLARDGVEAPAGLEAGSTSGLGDDGQWNWGPRVAGASWRPGPALDIQASGGMAPAAVGMWVDGWFQGEWELDEDGKLRLPSSDLAAYAGRELVVRVRPADGEWGVPWRSMVPDAYATPPHTITVTRVVLTDGPPDAEVCMVVHEPERANPLVQLSDAAGRLLVDGLEFPFFLDRLTVGRSDVAVGGNVQSWTTEPGRALDVYF